jgi:hypothetical protein
MAALIDLCNRALASIAKGQIASLDEPSLEARECKRYAQPLLNEMADWSDLIPLGQTRVVLAAVANDRPAEWNYAFAAPAGMAQAIAIRRAEEAAGSLPLGGPFTFPEQDRVTIAFTFEGTKIYTNVETPTLIYTRSQIDVTELSPLMQQAFADELAARVSMPLSKDPKLVDARMVIAERSRVRALADEENKTDRRQIRYVTEVEYARAGIGV